MAHIQINNLAKYENHTTSPKFGTVIYNIDPLNICRVKVSIPGIFDPEDETGSNLPWVRQMTDTFLCGNNTELYNVPEIGSIVEVRWPYDDLTPFYKGPPNNSSHCTFTDITVTGIRIGNYTFSINKETNQLTSTIGNSTININEDTITLSNSSSSIVLDSTGIHLNGDVYINEEQYSLHVHSNGNNGSNTGPVV